MATLEERIAALEARVSVEPRVLTPPITVGEMTNVPAPGAQLAAQWAQDASSRVVQRFPNVGALKASNLPEGAHAVDLATGVLWRRGAAAWTQVSPWAFAAAGAQINQAQPAGWYLLATINIPADPSSTRVAIVSFFVRVYKFGPTGDTVVQAVQSGAPILEAYKISTIDLSPVAGNHLPVDCVASGIFPLPANTVVPISIQLWKPSGNTGFTVANATYNRLDVLVVPKG